MLTAGGGCPPPRSGGGGLARSAKTEGEQPAVGMGRERLAWSEPRPAAPPQSVAQGARLPAPPLRGGAYSSSVSHIEHSYPPPRSGELACPHCVRWLPALLRRTGGQR